MEDLTKQQLILLALLLSFVTSIGTGIITVSLLRDAPQGVTQTINRVVEKTIENVLPTQTTIKETEKQTRVVVEKDDAITTAVAKAKKSLVRVYNTLGEEKSFFAIGFIVSEKGTIAVTGEGFVPEYKYAAVLDDGTQYDLKLKKDITSNNAVFFDIVQGEDQKDTFSSFTQLPSSDLRLGQSVINVGGEKDTSIQIGRISVLPKISDEEGNDVISGIETDIGSGTLGSLLIDFSGALIGYKAFVGEGKLAKTFVVTDDLAPIIKAESENPPTNNNP